MKLEVVRIGGSTYTSHEAIARFAAYLSLPNDSSPRALSAQRQKQIEQARNRLTACGNSPARLLPQAAKGLADLIGKRTKTHAQPTEGRIARKITCRAHARAAERLNKTCMFAPSRPRLVIPGFTEMQSARLSTRLAPISGTNFAVFIGMKHGLTIQQSDHRQRCLESSRQGRVEEKTRNGKMAFSVLPILKGVDSSLEPWKRYCECRLQHFAAER